MTNEQREALMERVRQIGGKLAAETQFRHRLIGEYENLVEQHADRYLLTQKHADIMACLDRMISLRIAKERCWERLCESGYPIGSE